MKFQECSSGLSTFKLSVYTLKMLHESGEDQTNQNKCSDLLSWAEFSKSLKQEKIMEMSLLVVNMGEKKISNKMSKKRKNPHSENVKCLQDEHLSAALFLSH